MRKFLRIEEKPRLFPANPVFNIQRKTRQRSLSVKTTIRTVILTP